MSVAFTQEEFNEKALQLLQLSEKVHDTWRIEQKGPIYFLVKNDKYTIERDLSVALDEQEDPSAAAQPSSQVFSIEYHVLLHPSYQVPSIYFNAYTDDRLINLNEVSRIFTEEYDKSQYEIHNIISQSEHPILFRPFYNIHPCKIGEVLANFPESKNFLITFLTLFGPSIRLKMSSDYEKLLIEELCLKTT